MATAIVMPKLGLTMEQGVVAKWLKREGEAVGEGEGVVEIETDKISNVVESPASGILLKILVPEGEEAPVLAPLGMVGQAGERT